ncbi:hypothetical protein C8R45DRAFT_1124104 [Mycena sanguinolenta]|nr:hypothetical protein C8R45DRAFT_1124104 [Mycena sanguinolenta]
MALGVGEAFPAFPPELERAIFEMAAFLWPRLILKFMLEPLLYRTIIVNRSIFVQSDRDDRLSTIHFNALVLLVQSKPAAFFRNSTRHLCVACDLADKGHLILSACSDIEGLWMMAQTHGNYILKLNQRLKRLHCSLRSIFGSSTVDLTHQIFSTLTHLEILDEWTDIHPEAWSALTNLPNLTHLAFNDRGYLPTCLTLLQTSKSLQVLVLLCVLDAGNDFVQRHN